MTILKANISMSLDGYVAGPNQTVQNPLGEEGEKLHEWAFATRSFQQVHGKEGGATGPDDDAMAEMFHNVGATIMGRNMFGGHGSWEENPWKGWWGDNPPFHTPVFVLTHHAREPLVMQGGTTFYFITDGIHSALEQAKKAAGDKDIHIGGGAQAIQQYLKAGLLDELSVHVAPMFLGGGSRLFEDTDGRQTEYELIRLVGTEAATHYKFRRR